jgi:ubiquinone/menaquinone biosynthesis C-methylase UbiE
MTDQPDLKSFDRVADVYDETRGLPPDVTAQIADRLAGMMRDVAPEPRLIEIGIGTGRMAVPLAALGVRVTGIDISTKMLAVLRAKRDDIAVMLAEAARPPLRPASFDAALFVHILHLVPDAEATLRATLPLIRRGGVLIEGRDDYRDSIREQAETLIRQTVADVAGIDMGARGWDAYDRGRQILERVVLEAGGRVETIPLATWPSRTTGRRMLDRLARKDFSSSWLVPDESLPDVLARATTRLDALLGGLTREVEFERAFSAVVAHLPA